MLAAASRTVRPCDDPDRDKAAVTPAERDELRSLVEAMDLPAGPLADLNVQG
jgi:hypothetical protein